MPLSFLVFLFTLISMCYLWAAYRTTVTLIPYLDPTKIEEVKPIVHQSLSLVSDNTMFSLGIVCVASLIASLLQAFGIVAANREIDAKTKKPNNKNKPQED